MKSLSVRKTAIYNRLSKEIAELKKNRALWRKRTGMYRKYDREIRKRREIQKLLDDIFNGEL